MKTSTLLIALFLMVFGVNAQQSETNHVTMTLNLEDQDVQLSWNTQREVNTSYFLVQRTSDGVNYETVARVNAAGNSNFPKAYSYSEIADPSKHYSYRVVLMTMEGIAFASNALSLDQIQIEKAPMLISNN